MTIDSKDLQNTVYSDESFWQKAKTYASMAGREVIVTALKLYYAMKDTDTPSWAKTIIVGALAYFILPTDAVPDVIPGGYVDDLGALAAAAWTVAQHIKDSHAEMAKKSMARWFGDKAEPPRYRPG